MATSRRSGSPFAHYVSNRHVQCASIPGFVPPEEPCSDQSLLGPLGTAYCERTFGSGLVSKKVDGRHIHGGELLHLIKAYVTTFHEATAFPEAKTLLAATSEANDRMAKDAALKSYKEEMAHECKKGYKGTSASLDCTCSDLNAICEHG